MNKPGLGVNAEVISVHDGDTLTVELKLRFPIRLQGIYSPELKEPGGVEAREALKSLVMGKECFVFIPSKNPLALLDSTTLGRMLADVFVDDVNVADYLISQGFGVKEKHK